MKTVQFEIFGSSYQKIPLIAPENIIFPTQFLNDFPHCCGAGVGIGNLIIPEHLLGVKVSAACFIHDYMWENLEPTWQYFHFANDVFKTNMRSIINSESSCSLTRNLRKIKVIQYYEAVDTIGALIFWGLVKEKYKGEYCD